MKVNNLIILALLVFSSVFIITCSSEDSGDGTVDGDGAVDGDGTVDGCIRIDRADSPTIIPPAGVRVSFRVLNCAGSPVRRLTSSDVTIINDEKEEPFGAGMEGSGVSDVGNPSNFALYSVLALDMSDSIFNAGAVDDVIDGALTFVEQLVTQPETGLKHEVALIAFGRPDTVEKILDFTSDSAVLVGKLEELRGSQSRGSTDLYGAYKLMLDEVENQGQGMDLVERFAVILTDGTHESGDEKNRRSRAMSAKTNSSAAIYSIGIQGNYDESKLIELASREDNFVRVENASELNSAFSDVADQVEAVAKSNYVVGVCTPVSLGNPTLTIEVDVDDAHGSKTISYDVRELNGDVASCEPEAIADPCKTRQCGPSGVKGVNCGTCPKDKVCNQTGACVDDPCDPDPCNDHGTCSPSDGSCTCDNEHMTADCRDCEDGYTGYPNCSPLPWYDSSSGLTWQNPPADSTMEWQEAIDYCDNLSLDGHSDWRLPTISELRSLIRGCPGTVTGGACGVTDSCTDSSCNDSGGCSDCLNDNGPADGCYWPNEMEGPCSYYWSSSPVEDLRNFASRVYFYYGSVYFADGDSSANIRCLR